MNRRTVHYGCVLSTTINKKERNRAQKNVQNQKKVTNKKRQADRGVKMSVGKK